MHVLRCAATLLLVLAAACSLSAASPHSRADTSAADAPSRRVLGARAAGETCQNASCVGADAQFNPHEYDQADPWHWQLMQHLGLLLVQHNTSADSSTVKTDRTGSTAEQLQRAARVLLQLEASNASTAADPQADAVSEPAASEASDDLDSAAPTTSTSSLLSVPSMGSTSTAIAALERKEEMINAMFRAALQRMGMADPSRAWVRYYRVKIARIFLLLTDIAWLMFSVGNLAQRTFALLVPIVKIGQTGQLTLTAPSVLNWAVLISDFVARLADLFTKILLVVFRGINLAATLPPAT